VINLSFLLRDKPAKVFLLLKNKSTYLSDIAKETGTTYVYITHLATLLQQKGMVTIQAAGKKKTVSLTDKGKEVATAVEDLRRKIE
jgi:predicted transcriptional regulator